MIVAIIVSIKFLCLKCFFGVVHHQYKDQQ